MTPFGPPDAAVPDRPSDATAAAHAARRAARARQFVRGPLPMGWFGPAALTGKALAVGLLVWFRRGFDRTGTEPVAVTQ